MRNQRPETAPRITRTAEGLRDVLFDEMERLRNDQSTPARARSVALLANSILQSVITEIEVHRCMADVAQIANNSDALGSLKLGKGKTIDQEST